MVTRRKGHEHSGHCTGSPTYVVRAERVRSTLQTLIGGKGRPTWVFFGVLVLFG